MVRKVLLLGGVLSSLVYVIGIDVIAALQFPEYHDYADQMVSELFDDNFLVLGFSALFAAQIAARGATVASTDRWGRRRFAYEIDHRTEGVYVV